MTFDRAMLQLLAFLPKPLRTWLMKPLMLQIMRFAVVGGLAFVVDFGLLLLLTEVVGLNYLVSATISFIVAVLFKSIMWVFTSKPQAQHSKVYATFKMVLFFVLSTCGLLINNAIMWAFVELFALSYILGKLVATFVVMVFNFVTRKILIEGWKRNHQSEQEDAPNTAQAAEQATSPSSEHDSP